jgi:hypothetical protein
MGEGVNLEKVRHGKTKLENVFVTLLKEEKR